MKTCIFSSFNELANKSPVVNVLLGNKTKKKLPEEIGVFHLGLDEPPECCNKGVNHCVCVHSDYGSTKQWWVYQLW